MKLRLFFIFFLVCSFKSFGYNLPNIPNDNQIDDSTDYNFFSPNNDSYNDFFTIEKIKLGDVKEAKFSVFNRWGDLVFEDDFSFEKNYYQWNGKGNQLNVKEEDLPEGVYLYRLEYKVIDKSTTTLGKIILKR